jgi:hypothetical protein
MDPLSIAATSATLVGVCVRLSGYIYIVINKVQNVDTSVRVLGIEIDLLSQVLGSISSSFSDSSLAAGALESQTGHEGQHWRNVKRSMEDCQETLGSLERILESVKQGERRFLQRPRMLIEFERKSGEIALLKQQITAYRQTMQLSLQLITVYVMSTTHINY